MHKAKIAIAQALVVATALAGFVPSMAKAAVVNNNQNVAISATVDNTLTFSINNTTLAMGSLSSLATRWANTTTGSASEAVAATFSLKTNATTGLSVTYTGNTLTSGSNTITAIGGTGASVATPGSEQFGMAFSTASGFTIDGDYDQAGGKYAFNSGDTVLSKSVPIDGTASAYYAANIGGLTEAGSYTTTITYTASSTF